LHHVRGHHSHVHAALVHVLDFGPGVELASHDLLDAGTGRDARPRAKPGKYRLVGGRLEDLRMQVVHVEIDHQWKIAVFHCWNLQAGAACLCGTSSESYQKHGRSFGCKRRRNEAERIKAQPAAWRRAPFAMPCMAGAPRPTAPCAFCPCAYNAASELNKDVRS